MDNYTTNQPRTGRENERSTSLEQRWQLIIYWAFRKYKLIYRLYPPLLGDQIMLPLA